MKNSRFSLLGVVARLYDRGLIGVEGVAIAARMGDYVLPEGWREMAEANPDLTLGSVFCLASGCEKCHLFWREGGKK